MSNFHWYIFNKCYGLYSDKSHGGMKKLRAMFIELIVSKIGFVWVFSLPLSLFWVFVEMNEYISWDPKQIHTHLCIGFIKNTESTYLKKVHSLCKGEP